MKAESLMAPVLLWGLITLATSLRTSVHSEVASRYDSGYGNDTASLEQQYLQTWSKNGIVRDGAAIDQRIAIFMVGLQDRLLLSSKLNQLLVPLFKQGYAVDVFLRLVASGLGNHRPWDFINGSADGKYANVTGLCPLIREKTKGIGNIASCTIGSKEDVSQVVDSLNQRGMKRFYQYSQKTRVGRNVLRRLASLEYLMNESTASGNYDYYLVTRDDDYWLSQLNMSAFRGMSLNNVYTIKCRQYGGVNDKTLLFGRESAKRVLQHLYTDVIREDPRLTTRNAEEYWRAYIDMKGAASVEVPHNLLPACDGTYAKRGSSEKICLKTEYLCSPVVVTPQAPPVC